MKAPHRTNRPANAGFTLMELIAVMAILTLLGTITAVALSGKRNDAKEHRARADLQVIQQGLEAYRARFGDYPRIPSETNPVASTQAYLLYALMGRIGPAHQLITGVPPMLNNGVLTLAHTGLSLTSVAEKDFVDNWIIDPWGSPYVYDYQPTDVDWETFGYELYSWGPDGAANGGDDIHAQ